MHSGAVLHTDSIQDGGHEYCHCLCPPPPAAPQSIFDCGEGILRGAPERTSPATRGEGRRRKGDEKKSPTHFFDKELYHANKTKVGPADNKSSKNAKRRRRTFKCPHALGFRCWSFDARTRKEPQWQTVFRTGNKHPLCRYKGLIKIAVSAMLWHRIHATYTPKF